MRWWALYRETSLCTICVRWMEVSKSRKRMSGVEDGDDQPNKKTKTDEAGGIHIFSMLYTHTHTHTHNVWHLGQTKVSCLWRLLQNAVTFMYVHVCYISLYHCTVCVSIGTLFVGNLSFDVDEDLLRESQGHTPSAQLQPHVYL